MTRPGVIRLNFQIWWANLCWRVYDVTHAPATDADGLTRKDREDIQFFRDAVMAKRAEQAQRVEHSYVQTWKGRLHDPDCACRPYGKLGPAPDCEAAA